MRTVQSQAVPPYSPRGDTDERPNALDARYVLTATDEPVDLPMTSLRVPYLVAAIGVLALACMIAGILFSRGP